MSEDQTAIADAGADQQTAGDQAAGDGAPADYALPASLKGFEGQLGDDLGELQRVAREHELSQDEFAALVTETYGDPAGQFAELERAFGAETGATLQAVGRFAEGLGRAHSEPVARLAATAAGVRLLDDLRRSGAGGFDVARHESAVKMLKSTKAGKAFLEAISVAKQGVAMPGLAAAQPAREQNRPATSAATEAEQRPPKTEAELQTMMRDPRYWRAGGDPAFRAEVTQGFAELFPGQVQTAVIAPTSGRGGS